MITGKPVVLIFRELLITYAGMLFNMTAPIGTTSTNNINLRSQRK